MRLSLLATILALTITGCSPTGPAASNYKLEVTSRSASTLTLRWPSMGSPDTYTVDYLTGLTLCSEFPMHNDIQHVTGTSVQLTGLQLATVYHIHVHLLPHSASGTTTTNTVLVSTLSAGTGEQAVVAADYQSRGSTQ